MNSITPQVTVLMPVYNGEKYLAEAIESILTQTYTDFELLIINDGSRDRSVEIIQSYDDRRIRLVNNEHNLGLVKTLNKGLDQALGKYIARMDQDDVSLPERLAEQVSYLDHHPKIGLCGTWIEVFGLGSYIEKYPTDHDTIKASLLFYNALAHPTVVMRKQMFEQYDLRYSIEYLHAEDYELWLRCSNCFEIANLGQVLLKYRTTPTSYCRVFTAEQAATLRRIDERNMRLLDIRVRNEYLELHKKIRDMQFIASREFVDQTAEWLELLCAANRAKKYYSNQALFRIAADYWFRVSRNARKLGLWTFWRFVRSPISGMHKQRNLVSLYLLLSCCKQEFMSRFWPKFLKW